MILVDPELDVASSLPSSSGAKLPSVRTLDRFLTQAQAAVRLRGHVTVLLTSDATMRDLNRRFRGKNKPTDVLSFPASNAVQSQEKGDLAISVETAIGQAVEQGHFLAVELKVLILHGLLHLAGYDHETDAGEMERREQSLRRRLGLSLGLIERATPRILSQRTRKDGVRQRKATTGPRSTPIASATSAQGRLSTPAAKAAFAQDDKTKRGDARRRKP
jgi:probable rRNA maturation factor